MVCGLGVPDAVFQPMRLCRFRFRDEGGVALVLALLVLAALSAGVVTTIAMSSSAQRTSNTARSRDTAYRLAEAGIASAMAVLDLPSNNALDPTLLPPPPPSQSAHLDRLATGSVSWGGVLSGSTWTLT